MESNAVEQPSQRRSFLRNLSLLGAASVPASMLARGAHAATPQAGKSLQLAQAEAMPVRLPTVTSAFPWFEEEMRK